MTRIYNASLIHPITTRLGESDYQLLIKVASQEGVTQTEVIRQAVHHYLKLNNHRLSFPGQTDGCSIQKPSINKKEQNYYHL